MALFSHFIHIYRLLYRATTKKRGEILWMCVWALNMRSIAINDQRHLWTRFKLGGYALLFFATENLHFWNELNKNIKKKHNFKLRTCSKLYTSHRAKRAQICKNLYSNFVVFPLKLSIKDRKSIIIKKKKRIICNFLLFAPI